MAEQNNELLMKNHEACLIGSAPFPEVNVTMYQRKVVGVDVVQVVLVIVVVILKIYLAT